MLRGRGRGSARIRPVTITKDFVKHPAGSALIHMGETRVLCTASVEESVPRWMKEQKVPGGWITAEYSMLPGSTNTRSSREVAKGKPSGRTQEIQRLIGRSMRAVTDLVALGPRTVWIDCDVLQADGGTRTASITGGFVALRLAIHKLLKEGKLKKNPVRESVAAISVGIVQDKPLLDLCYQEDFEASVDMNVVMTRSGEFVEVQGTAETKPFHESQMKTMLGFAKKGIRRLMAAQDKALKGLEHA